MNAIFHNNGSRTRVYRDVPPYAFSTGSAFVVRAGDISHRFRLDYKTSQTAAELVAI